MSEGRDQIGIPSSTQKVKGTVLPIGVVNPSGSIGMRNPEPGKGSKVQSKGEIHESEEAWRDPGENKEGKRKQGG